MRKLNVIIHERKCNMIQTIRDLRTKIKIDEKTFKALVNSKAISNFMSQFLMNKQ